MGPSSASCPLTNTGEPKLARACVLHGSRDRSGPRDAAIDVDHFRANAPTASWSALVLSVFSHGNVSRPKWPWYAVAS